jgi:hypothetical protein
MGCFLTKYGECFQFGVKRNYILRPLCNLGEDIIQFIPFVRAFYAFESPLFYNHHNHESNVIIIVFTMGTCQSDLLRRELFALTHFKALCSIISCFPSCLFPSIVDDTHMISPPLFVSFAYEHLLI